MATRVTATVSILLETFLTHPRLTGITIGSWIVYANLLPPVFSPYIIAMPFVIALGRAWQLAGSVCETTPDTAYVSVHVEDPSQE
ncbi:MAG: hypothetical protein OXF02_03305 [Simkaniaceae bacterium]|nr:hypothetical protein [Simkaniaceae bacterium]